MRMRQVRAWADIRDTGIWGVEVDCVDMTMDGHYICVTGHGDEGRRRAQIIVDAINGRRTPKTEVEPK